MEITLAFLCVWKVSGVFHNRSFTKSIWYIISNPFQFPCKFTSYCKVPCHNVIFSFIYLFPFRLPSCFPPFFIDILTFCLLLPFLLPCEVLNKTRSPAFTTQDKFKLVWRILLIRNHRTENIWKLPKFWPVYQVALTLSVQH